MDLECIIWRGFLKHAWRACNYSHVCNRMVQVQIPPKLKSLVKIPAFQQGELSRLWPWIEFIVCFFSLQYFCFWFGSYSLGFLSFISLVAKSSCSQFCACAKQIFRHDQLQLLKGLPFLFNIYLFLHIYITAQNTNSTFTFLICALLVFWKMKDSF